MGRYFFNPFSFILIFVFFGIMLILIPLLFFGFIGGAFTRLGFTWHQAFLILLFTLIGSMINIPLKKVENPPIAVKMEKGFFGGIYRIPEISPTTIIAVNVGGALIPVVISVYLILRVLTFPEGMTIAISALIAVLVVTFVTYRVARPIPGLGIATPMFVPPLCALICGIVLSWGLPVAAPVIAYIGGTLGTLIGADLLNLRRISELGAPVASIGGAGTFDGVFLTGVIAAFLA